MFYRLQLPSAYHNFANVIFAVALLLPFIRWWSGSQHRDGIWKGTIQSFRSSAGTCYLYVMLDRRHSAKGKEYHGEPMSRYGMISTPVVRQLWAIMWEHRACQTIGWRCKITHFSLTVKALCSMLHRTRSQDWRANGRSLWCLWR